MHAGWVRGFAMELHGGLERSGSPFCERLDRATAAGLADILAAQALVGASPIALARLHRDATGRDPLWRQNGEAGAWLRRAIATGAVAAFRQVPLIGAMDHATYAELLGIDRGQVDQAAMAAGPVGHAQASIDKGAAGQQAMSIAVFSGAGVATGVPDVVTDTCPSTNWRSESTDTCHPEVIAWFERKGVKDDENDYRNKTLGRNGGGGFLATTTQVKMLAKGTRLYRYVNDAKWPYGGWWFLAPLQGDPRVYAALPEDSHATVMVQGVCKRDVDVLHGLGAPRCSNKPGGPEQVFVARCDYCPDQGDILEIR